MYTKKTSNHRHVECRNKDCTECILYPTVQVCARMISEVIISMWNAEIHKCQLATRFTIYDN